MTSTPAHANGSALVEHPGYSFTAAGEGYRLNFRGKFVAHATTWNDLLWEIDHRCQHCGHLAEFGTDPTGLRTFVHVADGLIECASIDYLEVDDDLVEHPATCSDCGRPSLYDETDGQYHHAVDADRGCFLIAAERRADDPRHPAVEVVR